MICVVEDKGIISMCADKGETKGRQGQAERQIVVFPEAMNVDKNRGVKLKELM